MEKLQTLKLKVAIYYKNYKNELAKMQELIKDKADAYAKRFQQQCIDEEYSNCENAIKEYKNYLAETKNELLTDEFKVEGLQL